MRAVLFGLALCVTCLAEPTPDVEVVVPASAAHPQDWLHPQIRDNPRPDYRGKPAQSLAEFVAPEVISKIVVDQYAGPSDDVLRYLTALPTAAAQYFGTSLVLCQAPANPQTNGVRLVWTSTSTVTFESGRSGRLAVATVVVSKFGDPFHPDPPNCFGPDKVPFDSLYVSYVDPDSYRWYFVVPLQRKK
jgi:hypothetical protein